MRVLIADDEPLVRSYLRSLLLEALPADSEVLEASDGKELMSLVKDGRVDVAFVDIRMPKMDGFAAMGALDDEGRRIPWFVLSSHQDFAYAKRALELGASGYTLKPPSPEEIKAAVTTLRSASEAGRKGREDAFDRDWALFVGGDSEAVPDLGRGAAYSVGLVSLDGECGVEARMRRARTAARAIRDRSRRFSFSGVWCAACPWGQSGDIAVLAGFIAAEGTAESKISLRGFWTEAYLAAKGEEGERLRALALYSEETGEALDCLRLLRDLVELSQMRAILPSGAMSEGRGLDELSKNSASDVAHARRAGALAECLRGADVLGLRGAVTDYLSVAAGNRAVPRFLECFLGHGALSGSEAELVAACEDLLGADTPRSKDRDTIAAVEEYVRRRYAERIGVEQVAGVFGLTPNYLSALFHKRTGVTFVRYVTEIRLLKAREILREGKSVKETAWSVGYGSERHFTRLYRERFGHAPAVEKRNASKS